jgi:hypothetical protein
MKRSVLPKPVETMLYQRAVIRKSPGYTEASGRARANRALVFWVFANTKV